MNFKFSLLSISLCFFLLSCTEDNDISVPRNLQEYIATKSNNNLGEVIAYAASASGNTSLSYIFYYPEEGAMDIRYYEADSLNVDEQDFSKYRRRSLAVTDVFGGKLQRFSRSDSEENWAMVTYVLDGNLHKSNPIRLKNLTNATTWNSEVVIDFPEKLTPKFTWSDSAITNNAIYFQAISKEDDDEFISGTYTYDTFFQYLDTTNVVLNINVPETPEDLIEDTEYLFTMMSLSDDNWVNLVIQKTFIPRNLQEYLEVNSTKSIEVTTAFAASSSSSQSLSYIYYYPIIGASELRYYETESATVNGTNFSNYRRKKISDEAVYGGKLRRYSRTDAEESWCIVTYIIGDKLYKSEPIKIKNQTKPTEWLTDVNIDTSNSLEPIFTWQDGTILENTKYFQVITDNESNFLSGTFTTEKSFQYFNSLTFTSTINLETPPALIFADNYKFTLMGLGANNWVNLVIQESFIAE